MTEKEYQAVRDNDLRISRLIIGYAASFNIQQPYIARLEKVLLDMIDEREILDRLSDEM